MKRLAIALPLVALSACTEARLPPSPGAETRAFCVGVFDPVCRFFNTPVQLAPDKVELAGRAWPFYPVRQPVAFVDARGYRWVAPEGTLTDGASIPPIFVSVVGRPTSGEFRAASALHDAICGIGNEALPGYHSATWENAHRMFYEALRVSGTDERRAKIMFAAVYLGGPRWRVIRPPVPGAGIVVSSQGRWEAPATRGLRDRAFSKVPDSALREELRNLIRWLDRCGDSGRMGSVDACTPTIPEIEAYAWARERALLQLYASEPMGDVPAAPPLRRETPVVEDPAEEDPIDENPAPPPDPGIDQGDDPSPDI